MASGGDGKIFSNVAATQGPFTLYGGTYGVTATATWGGGSVTLQMLAPDGVTWITALAAFTANGYGAISLPPGQYRFLVTTATAVFVSIGRII